MIKNYHLENIIERVFDRCHVTKKNSDIFKHFIVECRIDVQKQDNFTIVILVDLVTNTTYAGVAKRAPNDHDVDNVGYNIAYTRAVENVLKTLYKK